MFTILPDDGILAPVTRRVEAGGALFIGDVDACKMEVRLA
jgi:hypothetical protein